jgi:hypothetical protein
MKKPDIDYESVTGWWLWRKVRRQTFRADPIYGWRDIQTGERPAREVELHLDATAWLAVQRKRKEGRKC